MQEYQSPSFKVIIVGDSSVGKTHIINQYVNGLIPTDVRATLGIDFLTKIVKDPSTGQQAKLCIYDTAGEEKYRAVTAGHYRNVKGCFIVYDVTSMDSFRNLDKWLKDARELTSENCVLMILGNKSDIDNITQSDIS